MYQVDMDNMIYNVGVFPGKFFPPHRGHLNSIIQAATRCDKLYVVVSDNMDIANEACKKAVLPLMPLNLRALWISLELQDIEHIEVITIDETGIPPYPEGTKQWSALLKEGVPERFGAIFGGELEYQDTYMQNFPNVMYEVHDYKRSRYPISATEVRENYLAHWDYILGSARRKFARRILITGTESCGKTTMVKYLGKIFNTSWTEEYGRHYPDKYLGGNDKLLTHSDFFRIAYDTCRIDEDAMRTANRIAFFDTDAVVTQFYCELYTGSQNPAIEVFVDPDKYDVVVVLSPEVQWVPDGMRWISDRAERKRLHRKLADMYNDRGFKRIMFVPGDSYQGRLNTVVQMADNMLENRLLLTRF